MLLAADDAELREPQNSPGIDECSRRQHSAKRDISLWKLKTIVLSTYRIVIIAARRTHGSEKKPNSYMLYAACINANFSHNAVNLVPQ